jgi:hypothetical protein|tara:strand:- start:281 stop:466 length:186 start_codon:yes stop_codon:yes gene_type:complete
MKHCNVCPYPLKCTARVKCRLGNNVVEEVEIEISDAIPVKEEKSATKSTKTVKKPKKTKKK